MDSIVTHISVSRYKFKIIDNIVRYEGEIFSRNFTIKTKNSNPISIVINYNNSEYSNARMLPNIHCECKFFIIAVKTLLHYINQTIPNIEYVLVDDWSHINLTPLYFFSMAFNGITWYEKHFNAKQNDHIKHAKYRETLDLLLYSEEYKANMSFINFLHISTPPLEIAKELESYYNNAKTIEKFFHSIPKKDRYRLVKDWINTFMRNELQDSFENRNWIMPIQTNSISEEKEKYYFCPKGEISYLFNHTNLGVNPEDV